MRKPVTEVNFWQVVPSALTFIILGCGSLFLYPSWTWFGGLGVRAIILGCVLGIAMYALPFYFLCTPRLRPVSMEVVMQNLRAMFLNLTWPQIIVLSVLAGIGEELLLRAWLQTWLHTKTGPWLAIFLASLVFGLLHFMNIAYVLITFVAGVVLGVAFYYSNSLILVATAHVVYDVCAFAMIVKFPHMLGLQSKDEFNNPNSQE